LSIRGPFPGNEVDHSPPLCAEVKERVELCLHSPNTPSWGGAELKHGVTTFFTFTLPSYATTTPIKS
jgi:hypothetical protein